MDPQPISLALQQSGVRTATFRPRFESDLDHQDYSKPLPPSLPSTVIGQNFSSVREEERLSLGDVPGVRGMDILGGSSGSETDDSCGAETDVSYMSDNQYDMEDMDMDGVAVRGLHARPRLKLEQLNSHRMRKSVMTLDDVCDTVVSPVKSMWNAERNEYFPDTADNAQYVHPLQIVVNDEHGGKMSNY
jgi:hypothetical protein